MGQQVGSYISVMAEAQIKAEKRSRDFRTASSISNKGDFITLKYFCFKALKDYPDDPDFWNFLGIAQLNTDEKDNSKNSFLKAYKLSWRKAIYLNNFLATAMSQKAIVTAFKILEKEFPLLTEDNKTLVLELLDKLADLEVLEVGALHRWLSRNRVVDFHKYQRLFRFIASFRKKKLAKVAV